MKKIAIILLACPLAQPALAAQPAQEGLWEYSVQMEMPGMPSHPMTHRVCLSSKEMEEGPVPKDQNCKVMNYKLSGQTATWQMECQGPDKVSGEGRITFQSNSAYQGETRMRIQPKGEAPMEMKQKFSAKRLGNCK